MTFDYNTLKRASRDGSRLGNWNGKAVFAASANDLENKGSGAYYILYDDENRIVARTNNGWKSFGEVTSQGSVNEYSSARNYKTPAEAAAAARKAKAAIKKAFEYSQKGIGLSFVEIVATCNSGWKMSPVAANKWMVENMFPKYPLGDIKDVLKQE